MVGYAQQKDVTEVLFVGNSFTFFWNMPEMVEAMAKDQDIPLITRQSTISGSNLEQHYKEEKGTESKKIIEKENYDYVILQDHSSGTIGSPERFREYSTKMAELARSNGAEPLFFTTWAYKSNPLMQTEIEKAYTEIAQKLKSRTVPVGAIFLKANEMRPDMEMYFDDKHPSHEGSYLIALIFYKYLTGHSVESIPDRLTTKDASGNNLYLSFISPKNGNFLRQLVDEFQMESLNISK